MNDEIQKDLQIEKELQFMARNVRTTVVHRLLKICLLEDVVTYLLKKKPSTGLLVISDNTQHEK